MSAKAQSQFLLLFQRISELIRPINLDDPFLAVSSKWLTRRFLDILRN